MADSRRAALKFGIITRVNTHNFPRRNEMDVEVKTSLPMRAHCVKCGHLNMCRLGRIDDRWVYICDDCLSDIEATEKPVYICDDCLSDIEATEKPLSKKEKMKHAEVVILTARVECPYCGSEVMHGIKVDFQGQGINGLPRFIICIRCGQEYELSVPR